MLYNNDLTKTALKAFSGFLFGIDPFNQPGVEAYKKEMFRLLGK